MKNIPFIERYNTDVVPVLAGHEKCAPSHTFGPYVRDYFLIHFCLAGKGVITDKSGTHSVSAGEVFIIRPDEVTVYSADATDPWEYAWIGFVGARSELFYRAPTVTQLPVSLGERARELVLDDVTATAPYIAVIYEIIYHLFSSDETDTATNRLRRVRRYIQYNYMQDLSVASLARDFGFDRSHLFRIFKERYGVGLKEYITRVRMENAARLLEDGFSVSETAALVGYPDPFNFSKAFKAYYGIPPSKY
ncbi:MAG: AraC family transcriptional regulator [Clostridia bacterium]|nr:AraC family transcriptional regulator [Clostridia bacterium]